MLFKKAASAESASGNVIASDRVRQARVERISAVSRLKKEMFSSGFTLPDLHRKGATLCSELLSHSNDTSRTTLHDGIYHQRCLLAIVYRIEWSTSAQENYRRFDLSHHQHLISALCTHSIGPHLDSYSAAALSLC